MLAAPKLRLKLKVKNPLVVRIKFIKKIPQTNVDIKNDKLFF